MVRIELMWKVNKKSKNKQEHRIKVKPMNSFQVLNDEITKLKIKEKEKKII